MQNDYKIEGQNSSLSDEEDEGAKGKKGPTPAQVIGKRGEDAAARYLEKRGYEILDRNWKCRAGEVDIVCRDDNAIIFCEVKTRTSIDRGLPSQAVDAKKRSKYEKIAAYYLKQVRETDLIIRFDIMSLLVVSEHRAMIRHHINAWGHA